MLFMRAVVTGASGFLGSRVLWQLRAHGHKPVALIRETADRSRFASFDPDVAVGDVTDRASLDAAFDDADLVIHTAAAYEMGPDDPTRLEIVNVDGSANVFAAAANAHVPVVHVSSVTALGPTGPEPMAETYWSQSEPASHYERTKREAHLLARDFQAKGADVRIGIPGGVYGPGDTSTLGRLMRLYMRVPMPVLAFRDAVQSLVYIDDCADGLLRIAEDGTPSNEYVLCAETVTMRAWIDAMMAAVDKPTPLVYIPDSVVVQGSRVAEWVVHAFGGPHHTIHEYVATATRSYAYSGAKARRELGWNPRPLSVGLDQLAAAHGIGRTRPRPSGTPAPRSHPFR